MTDKPKQDYESATGKIPLDNFGNDIKPDKSTKPDPLLDHLNEKFPKK
jgi:hypothetical protein